MIRTFCQFQLPFLPEKSQFNLHLVVRANQLFHPIMFALPLEWEEVTVSIGFKNVNPRETYQSPMILPLAIVGYDYPSIGWWCNG